MSDDNGEQRRARRGDAGGPDGREQSQPVTAAGRRRRDDEGGPSLHKSAATPTRSQQETVPEGSLFERLRRFLREVVAELRKVHWPTRRQIVVYTGVVLVFVAFMVALVYGLDAMFSQAVFALFG